MEEGFIRRERVLDRCRIRVLGGEPVIDGDDLGVRPPADLRGQFSGQEGIPDHVHAAMEVQDNMARFDSLDGDLGGSYAAQLGFGHGHLGGQRLRRHQLPEQPPLLVDTAANRKGRLPQDCVEGLLLFDAHGASCCWRIGSIAMARAGASDR